MDYYGYGGYQDYYGWGAAPADGGGKSQSGRQKGLARSAPY